MLRTQDIICVSLQRLFLIFFALYEVINLGSPQSPLSKISQPPPHLSPIFLYMTAIKGDKVVEGELPYQTMIWDQSLELTTKRKFKSEKALL